MKNFALFITLLLPLSVFAEWNCDIKLIDAQTISITGTNLGKFKFTDEDNMTVFKKDGTKRVVAMESVDNISFSGEVSVTDVASQSNIIYPNPAVDIINVSGAAGLEYIIVNYSAITLKSGVVPEDETLDISQLESGDYVIVLSDRRAFKFIKK